MKFTRSASGELVQKVHDPIGNALDNGANWIDDKVTGAAHNLAEAFVSQLGDILKDLGLVLLQYAPDLLICVSMAGCLGAILGFKKSGQWAIGSFLAAVLLQAIGGVYL